MMTVTASTGSEGILAASTSEAATTAASEEHLEYLAWIMSVESTTTSAALIDIINISTLVVLVSFSCITEDFIAFTNIFEHLIRMYLSIFVIVLMFVWMPS